ncbi:MAG: hypothetical protein ACYTEK_03870 [Planctomycetota bacterium]|jgi:hypothetical protein
MNAGIEFVFEPLRFEILQWELLFQEMAEVLPTVVIVGIPLLYGLVWLLAGMDCMSQKDRNTVDACDTAKKADLFHPSSEDRPSQPATRLLCSDTNAAA